jgi:cytoskeletal protein CcmA (bactofilin family)
MMALWDKPENAPAAAAPASNTPPRSPQPAAALSSESAVAHKERKEMKESIIASGLSIEGKIVGSGHIRVAGKFKGDIQVEGNLHVDNGARVEGQVRASEVLISGELQGNIESAKRVELQQGGSITGDVKAGSFTVAAGSRMRGAVDFGFDDSTKAAMPNGSRSSTP